MTNSSLPVPRSWDGRPARRLPGRLTSFVGREAQLIEVRRLLGETRLLTLTGMAGVGKTRFAARLAELAQRRYADGAWWVDLVAADDPAAATAAALGIYEQPDRPATATLADAMAARSLLLVLDNCEHVRVAAADLAATLLAGCPGVAILATSREALGAACEVRWAVPPLELPPVPEAGHSRQPALAAIAGAEAVRLFVARARAVQPDFALTAATAPVVARICRALDGLPLAIELAAARVRLLTVEQIADRLDDRFRLLAGSGGALPERHRTLRAALDGSHALLTPPEQTLLRRLAVFAGRFDLEAVERICAGANLPADAVLDLLGALVDKSLVSVAAQDSRAWYRLLDTVHLYALEKLQAAGEAEPLRERHAAYFLGRAALWPRVSPGHTVRALMDRWEAEGDELRAALAWSDNAGAGQAAAFLAVVDDLATFWQARGHYSEARRWVPAARARAHEADPVLRCRVFVTAGWLAFKTGDVSEALHLAEEAHRQAVATGDAIVRGRALCLRAWLALLHGDPRADALAAESVTYLRDSDAPAELGLALLIRAGAAAFAGDRATALALGREALALAESLEYQALAGSALLLLAQEERHAGDLTAAAGQIERALTLMPLNDSFTLAYALEELATIATDLGAAEQAVRLAGAAERCRAEGARSGRRPTTATSCPPWPRRAVSWERRRSRSPGRPGLPSRWTAPCVSHAPLPGSSHAERHRRRNRRTRTRGLPDDGAGGPVA